MLLESVLGTALMATMANNSSVKIDTKIVFKKDPVAIVIDLKKEFPDRRHRHNGRYYFGSSDNKADCPYFDFDSDTVYIPPVKFKK